MKRLYEFLFNRWKQEVIKRGTESWACHPNGINGTFDYDYQRSYVEYKYTNKFDGSVKIKRKYIN